ncbi:Cohesin subunit SA-1 [Hordeum vulgare]|nr:Cohesin subunit SA-1 [Hordeum vulgare]
MPVRTRGWDNDQSEEPPSSKRQNYDHYHEVGGPTNFYKVIMAPRLEAIPMPLDFMKHFSCAIGVQAEDEHWLPQEGDCLVVEWQGHPRSGLGHLRRRAAYRDRLHGDLQAAKS